MSGSRSGRGAKELLRIGLVVEWPAGGGDVFAVGHTGSLENQSAIVADVVLGELRGGRWKRAGRYPTVLALESFFRTTCHIDHASRDPGCPRQFVTSPAAILIAPSAKMNPQLRPIPYTDGLVEVLHPFANVQIRMRITSSYDRLILLVLGVKNRNVTKTSLPACRKTAPKVSLQGSRKNGETEDLATWTDRQLLCHHHRQANPSR